MVGFVNARRVHQNHLGHLGSEDGPQAVAGGLGHRGGDRHLFPHQLIHQGGFAHVRATNQCDEARAVILWQGSFVHSLSLRRH